jgi:hypothetical protein
MWCSRILWSFTCRHLFSLPLRDGSRLKPICRLIVAELPAREVIVTLDSTRMDPAMRHASNRKYENVSAGF